MNRDLRLAALAVFACASLASCARVLSGSQRTVEHDERDVLLAVIQHLEALDGSGQKPVVRWFSMGPVADHLLPRARDLRAVEIRFPLEVFPDLVRRSGTPAPVWSLIGDSTRVRWVTPAPADSLRAAGREGIDGLRLRLREMYPGAAYFVGLSRAGFDERRSHAAVAFGTACGALCGSAGVVLLERRRGRWHVLRQVPMIIS